MFYIIFYTRKNVRRDIHIYLYKNHIAAYSP